jgi:Zn-finger nucleic acid-binding protein
MCPVCEQPMVAFELEGVEIDRCVSCRGTWLDNGELQLIAALAGVAAGGLTAALVEAKSSRGGPRRCPRCIRRLGAIDVGGVSPIEIDRCPGGCGLWFDDGEMGLFMARFDEGEKGAVARFFADWFGKKDTVGAS